MSTTYKRLEWDEVGNRYYDAGVDRGVMFPMNADGTYEAGEAWNGLTKCSANPDGGELKEFYANNHLYASFRGVEKPKGTIEAYTYPDGFAECDGSKAIAAGVFAKQQKRRPFGLAYRHFIGEGDDYEGTYTDNNVEKQHYVLHILYGLTVSPSERSHDTINEDPDLEVLSWEYSGTPVALTEVTGFKPMGEIEIDSRKVAAEKLAAIEDALYGVSTVAAGEGVSAVAGSASHILLPDDIYDILTTA